MTSKKQPISPGESLVARPLNIVVSLNPPERDGDVPPSPAADLSNVIPFARKTPAEPSPPVAPVTAADRPAPPLADLGRYHLIAIVLVSILVHAGLFYLFWQQPRQLTNVGFDAIEIEIVVGDNRAAGTATTPSETEAQQSPVAEEVKKEEEEKPLEREVPPETAEAIFEREPPKEQPTPIPPSAPSDSASGSGRRAVAGEANYYAQVAKHLARYQQYPAAARNNRVQGRGTVTFTINGDGSVTSVEIVRSSGAAILDQEILAMVRRAAPFPKPRNGEAVTFTQAVGFKLN
jgi:TonB family protein